MRTRHQPFPRAFTQLLANSLVTGTVTTFAWFALSFWVYLETGSVVAVSVIGGSYALATALLGVAFGTYVDHHRKHQAITVTSVASTLSFAAATLLYRWTPHDDLLSMRAPWFWLLMATVMLGAVAGGLRAVVLPTCVTLLIPADDRARANGAVGTVNGIAFTATGVFSGMVVGGLGMGWALGGATVVCALTTVHAWTICIDEPPPEPAADDAGHLDVGAALAAIRAVPGLGLLVLFAAYNNLLGGVFMALLDAYGLSLMTVEAWGVLFGLLSLGFIAGGAWVARRGLGPDALRVILIGNLIGWGTCIVFPARSSVVFLAVGMLVWMVQTPFVEAAEQTVLQATVPYETQGRVFGFAQTVENLTSPITAFLIGPLAEALVIPWMDTGSGADAIGDWFGRGPERGMALVFCLAGVGGVLGTVALGRSRSYRLLSARVGVITGERNVEADLHEPLPVEH